MDETLVVKWGKSFLQVSDGKISIKQNGSFIMNGVLGGMPGEDVLCDEIEKFSLLCFDIYFKRSVNFILLHKESGTKYRIEIIAKADDVKKFERFRDIMKEHGVFEDKSRREVFYGKDSDYQKRVEEAQERREKIKTENDIFKEKVKALPGYKVIGLSSEIEHLRTVLFEGEQLLSVISGDIESRDTLITCTDKRVLFIESGMFSNETKEVMIGKINSVTFEQRSSYGNIRLQYGVETKEITMVPQESIKAFVDAVHKAMDMQNQSQRGTAQTPAASVADELLKYKQLLDMGAITEDEFNKLKSDIIK